jgi:hypothetical protein
MHEAVHIPGEKGVSGVEASSDFSGIDAVQDSQDVARIAKKKVRQFVLEHAHDAEFDLSDMGSLVRRHVTRTANQARPDTIVARASDKAGPNTKTRVVVKECGSVSSGVKNQAAKKNVATAAASTAKTAEVITRRLDLPKAVVIRIKPNVGGMQFHRITLVPKPS